MLSANNRPPSRTLSRECWGFDMKLPNGYGSVSKLKGKRRNPWAIRKTTGKTEDRKPIVKYVGYYATRADALAALAAYNKHPYHGVTMNDLFEHWAEESTCSASTMQTYRYTWPHIGKLGDRDMNSLKLDDFQPVFDELSHSTGYALKNVVSGIYSYAVRHEYVLAEKAAIIRYIRIREKSRMVKRVVFSTDEINNCTDHAVRVLLYTGMRISELLELTKDCIHLKERWIDIRKSKTPAGVRKVPIAEKIVDDVKALDCFGMTYPVFKRQHFTYKNHTIHDTRHTFISRCADLRIDERTIRAIVGHAGSGITESIYTHLNMQTLLDAVNKL